MLCLHSECCVCVVFTERVMWAGVDVVVGTPGRINDFVEKGTLRVNELKHTVLDEVDRMLDMGFADVVENILKVAYTGKRSCGC